MEPDGSTPDKPIGSRFSVQSARYCDCRTVVGSGNFLLDHESLYIFRHPMQVLAEVQFAIGLVVVLAAITAITVAAVFRNGYDAHFGINEDGAWMTPQSGQRETSKNIHKMLFGLGILAGKPGATGMAMIAEASQDKSIAWSNVASPPSLTSRNRILRFLTLCAHPILLTRAVRRSITVCSESPQTMS